MAQYNVRKPSALRCLLDIPTTELYWDLLEQSIERAQQIPFASTPDLDRLGMDTRELVELQQ